MIAAAAVAMAAAAGPGVDVGKLARDYATLSERDQGKRAMVLVSFSMPADSLSRLAAAAARAGVVLVLNGLHRRSMQQTAAAISEVDPDAAATWQIDPRQFARFKAQAVPLFVVSAGGSAGTVRGDVSLPYALQQISRHWAGSETGAHARRLHSRIGRR